MLGLYDIYKGEKKIGKAEVSREGLYYRFRCCCDLPGDQIHRLTVSCGGKTENLGIPIPGGDTFWLSVRLPVSRFPQGEPLFYALPKENKNWLPVSEDTPFPYLAQLSDAVLTECDGKIGLVISKPEQPDNDRNP